MGKDKDKKEPGQEPLFDSKDLTPEELESLKKDSSKKSEEDNSEIPFGQDENGNYTKSGIMKDVEIEGPGEEKPEKPTMADQDGFILDEEDIEKVNREKAKQESLEEEVKEFEIKEEDMIKSGEEMDPTDDSPSSILEGIFDTIKDFEDVVATYFHSSKFAEEMDNISSKYKDVGLGDNADDMENAALYGIDVFLNASGRLGVPVKKILENYEDYKARAVRATYNILNSMQQDALNFSTKLDAVRSSNEKLKSRLVDFVESNKDKYDNEFYKELYNKTKDLENIDLSTERDDYSDNYRQFVNNTRDIFSLFLTKMQDYSSNIASINKDISEIEKEKQSLEENVSELETELKIKKDSNNELAEELTKREQKIRELQEETARLNAGKDRSISELRESYRQLEQESQKYKDQLSQANRHVENLQTEKNDLEGIVKTKQENLEEQSKKISEIKTRHKEELKDVKDDYQKQVDDWKEGVVEQIEEKDEENKRLETKVKELVEKNDILNKDINKYKSLEEDYNQSEEEISRLKQELDSYKENEKEYVGLEKRIEELKETKNKQKKEIEEKEKEYQIKINELKQEKCALGDALDEQSDELVELREKAKKTEDLKAEIKDKESELFEKEQELIRISAKENVDERLGKILEQRNDEINKLLESNSGLKRKLDKLKRSLGKDYSFKVRKGLNKAVDEYGLGARFERLGIDIEELNKLGEENRRELRRTLDNVLDNIYSDLDKTARSEANLRGGRTAAATWLFDQKYFAESAKEKADSHYEKLKNGEETKEGKVKTLDDVLRDAKSKFTRASKDIEELYNLSKSVEKYQEDENAKENEFLSDADLDELYEHAEKRIKANAKKKRVGDLKYQLKLIYLKEGEKLEGKELEKRFQNMIKKAAEELYVKSVRKFEAHHMGLPDILQSLKQVPESIIKEYIEKLKRYEIEKQDLEEKAEKTSKELEKAERESEILKKDIEDVEDKLIEDRIKLKKYFTENKDYQEKTEEQEKLIEKLTRYYEKHKERANKLADEKEILLSEKDDYEERIEILSKDYTKLRREWKKNIDKLGKAYDQRNVLEKDINDSEDKLIEDRILLEEYKKDLEEAEEDIFNYKQKIEDLEQRLASEGDDDYQQEKLENYLKKILGIEDEDYQSDSVENDYQGQDDGQDGAGRNRQSVGRSGHPPTDGGDGPAGGDQEQQPEEGGQGRHPQQVQDQYQQQEGHAQQENGQQQEQAQDSQEQDGPEDHVEETTNPVRDYINTRTHMKNEIINMKLNIMIAYATSAKEVLGVEDDIRQTDLDKLKEDDIRVLYNSNLGDKLGEFARIKRNLGENRDESDMEWIMYGEYGFNQAQLEDIIDHKKSELKYEDIFNLCENRINAKISFAQSKIHQEDTNDVLSYVGLESREENLDKETLINLIELYDANGRITQRNMDELNDKNNAGLHYREAA